MSEDEVTGREFERLLNSIDASQQSTAESGKVTARTLAEIKEYMLHNDYRHVASEGRIEKLETNMSVLAEILEDRRSVWESLKKVKWVITLLAMGIITAAGTGIYNYLAKPKPVINNKELTVKPLIKVIK